MSPVADDTSSHGVDKFHPVEVGIGLKDAQRRFGILFLPGCPTVGGFKYRSVPAGHPACLRAHKLDGVKEIRDPWIKFGPGFSPVRRFHDDAPAAADPSDILVREAYGPKNIRYTGWLHRPRFPPVRRFEDCPFEADAPSRRRIDELYVDQRLDRVARYLSPMLARVRRAENNAVFAHRDPLHLAGERYSQEIACRPLRLVDRVPGRSSVHGFEDGACFAGSIGRLGARRSNGI